MTKSRDTLLRSLLCDNLYRPAWPIWSVLPLMHQLGYVITWDDWQTFIGENDVAQSVRDDVRKLARERFDRYTPTSQT